MKNLYAFDFVNKTIVASKTTLKKASKPSSPEYKELLKMIAKQPTFSVVEKDINIKANKKTYSGLSYEVMEAHIKAQSNHEKSLATFYKAKKDYKYPTVKSWFLSTYPNFKINEGKKDVVKAKIVKAAS